MPLDVGRVTHLADKMHRAEASNGSAIASNWLLSTDGTKAVTWRPESAGGGALSYGSNATDVSSFSTAGASSLVTRADHVHRGVRTVTANGSNSLFGDVNLQAGTGIALGVSAQTVTISNIAEGGGGGGGSLTDHTHAVAGSGATGGGGTLNVPTLNATGLVRLSTQITSTINADTNDYNPTGLHTAGTIRFTSLSATRNLTGLNAGVEGELILLINNSSGGSLQLVNESAASSAANRFRSPATIAIRVSGSCWIMYSAGRWCVVAL